MKVSRPRLIDSFATAFLTFLIFDSAAIIGTAVKGQEVMSNGRPVEPRKEDLKNWKVEDSVEIDGLYDLCGTGDSTCLGLPDGCTVTKNCKEFLQIFQTYNQKQDYGYFTFYMYLDRTKEALGIDSDHWIGAGLNQVEPKMKNSAVVMCYFGVNNGEEVNALWTGWATGNKMPDPARLNRVQIIKGATIISPGIHNFTYQKLRSKTFLKCSFRLEFTIQVTEEGNMKGSNAPVAKFDLIDDDLALLFATGHLGAFKQNKVPVFNKHTSVAILKKQKLTPGSCFKASFCLGTGPSGCFAKIAKRCAFFLQTTKTVNDFVWVDMYADERLKPKYLGFALSNGRGASEQEVVSKIFFVQTCNAKLHGYYVSPKVSTTNLQEQHTAELVKNCKLTTKDGKIKCEIKEDVKKYFLVNNPRIPESQQPYYVRCVSLLDYINLSRAQLNNTEQYIYLFVSNTSFYQGTKSHPTFEFSTKPEGIYSIRTRGKKVIFSENRTYHKSPDISEHPWYREKSNTSVSPCSNKTCGFKESSADSIFGGGHLLAILSAAASAILFSTLVADCCHR